MIASLTNILADIKQKFEALNARERWMVIGAALCLLYGLYSFTLEPVQLRQQILNNEINQDLIQKQNLEQQLAVFSEPNHKQNESPEAVKVKALKVNLLALDQEIDGLKHTLIRPKSMPDLLSDLLKKNEQLTLVSLKTLTPKGLFDDFQKENTSNKQDLPIFKHSVEITIKGHYLDLLHYIEGVEGLPWHLLWDKAILQVENKPETAFPMSEITLTVYTLSLDKNWLSI